MMSWLLDKIRGRRPSPIALRRNDRGPVAYQLQLDLIALGYPLPRFGADALAEMGGIGDETLAAMKCFLERHGAAVDDGDYNSVTEAELALLTTTAVQARAAAPAPHPLVIDRTVQAAHAGEGHFMGWRSWSETTAIMFHQTACWLSSSTDIARCDAVGAHRVIYPDGRTFLLHALNKRIVHGHGGNARCIGYEIDGNLHGVEGRPNTLWRGGGRAAVLGELQIEAVKAQARRDVAEVLAHGGKVQFALVHRQASRDRRGDPGSAIYKQIVLPLMDELGLEDGGPGWVFADGNGGAPVPGEWDETRTRYPY
ncbi:MAG: hypothetical protein ABIR65_01240 [Pseudolysinimonas sp.]